MTFEPEMLENQLKAHDISHMQVACVLVGLLPIKNLCHVLVILMTTCFLYFKIKIGAWIF